VFSSGFSQNWTQLADCPGGGRFWAASFNIGNTLYAGTGITEFSGTVIQDMWAFDTETGTWSQIADYPGGVRQGATGFSTGDRGFMAFGSPFIQFSNEVYEYLPASNEWSQKASCPASFAYSHGFVIDGTYYIGPENGTNKVYAYDIEADSWSEKASFPGQDRRSQVSFSSGGKGYIGMGLFVFGGVLSDFYAYDPLADTWEQIASMSPASDQSSAFAINDEGYVSNVGGNFHSVYHYNAQLNEWEFVAPFAAQRIANATTTGFNGKGYLVFGETTGSGGNVPSNALWEFIPSDVSVKNDVSDSFLIYSQGNGVLKINSELNEVIEIHVYSLNGQLMFKGSSNSGNTLLQTGLNQGVVLVHIRLSGGREIVRKVIL
jgi:N-acetylneuraminic acid mutarotase